jgi:hypothetical protein
MKAVAITAWRLFVMKKTYKILAIIAALILVIKYIPVEIVDILLKVLGSPPYIGHILIDIVFTVAMVIAFSYLAKYFKSIAQSGITKLIYMIIIFQIISVLIVYIPGFGKEFYMIARSVSNGITIIFFIIAGIKIMRLKAINDRNVRLAKLFIQSLLVVMLANYLATATVLALGKLEYVYIITFLYTVPFLILAFMFWKMAIIPTIGEISPTSK